jgi:hypothetical protein
MRAHDRELPAVAAELLAALTAGRKPNLTATEWDLLTTFCRRQGKPDRRGHSIKRHIQGANRRMLQDRMRWLKRKLRNDPAERKIKRSLRGTYDLNRRVAEVMHERLVKAGRDNVPSVSSLKNILSRSIAADDPSEPW